MMPGSGDSSVIDLVTHDPRTDEVVLVISQMEPWGAKGERLPDLQDKLRAYLLFVEGGQLARTYPHMAGKRVRFRLDCVGSPGATDREFLKRVREVWLAPAGFRLEVREYPEHLLGHELDAM